MVRYTKEEQEWSRDVLMTALAHASKPSKERPVPVYCIIRHVSSSGMSRVIQFLVFRTDGSRTVDPLYLGFHVARVLGWAYDRKREGVKVQGAGMDMCFHTLYTLGQVLFNDGYALTPVTL